MSAGGPLLPPEWGAAIEQYVADQQERIAAQTEALLCVLRDNPAMCAIMGVLPATSPEESMTDDQPVQHARPTVHLTVNATAAVDPDDVEAVETMWNTVHAQLDAIHGVVCTGGTLRPVEP